VTVSQKRILIVEDDPALARVIIDNLTFEKFHVEWVSDGSRALSAARNAPPDLVLLDLTLPDRDGLDLCSVLREGGRVPIIILSARSQKADKLAGLKLGADDYVTKPFDLEELLARIGALLRRCRPTVETMTLGRVHIDLRIPRATCGRDELHLTHREFEVLRYLAERSDKIVHRDELLREVWGYLDVPAANRSVDHAIARLRRKIEVDPRHPRFIRTAHGDGYSLSLTGASLPDATSA
jgi:DNA-binding response OmpR family regulator